MPDRIRMLAARVVAGTLTEDEAVALAMPARKPTSATTSTPRPYQWQGIRWSEYRIGNPRRRR